MDGRHRDQGQQAAARPRWRAVDRHRGPGPAACEGRSGRQLHAHGRAFRKHRVQPLRGSRGQRLVRQRTGRGPFPQVAGHHAVDTPGPARRRHQVRAGRRRRRPVGGHERRSGAVEGRPPVPLQGARRAALRAGAGPVPGRARAPVGEHGHGAGLLRERALRRRRRRAQQRDLRHGRRRRGQPLAVRQQGACAAASRPLRREHSVGRAGSLAAGAACRGRSRRALAVLLGWQRRVVRQERQGRSALQLRACAGPWPGHRPARG